MNWAMWCHLSVLLGCFLPPAQLIGPIIIYAIRGENSSLVREHAKAVINFQLSYTVLYLLFVLLIWVFNANWIILILFLLIILGMPIFIILGAVRAKTGRSFVYPLSFEVWK